MLRLMKKPLCLAAALLLCSVECQAMGPFQV